MKHLQSEQPNVFKRIIKTLILSALYLYLQPQAKAQVVNIQNALSAPIQGGWSLQLDISQSQLRGNIDSDNLYVNSTNTYRSRNNLLLAMFKRDFGTYEGEKSSDSIFGHLRYAFYFSRRWSWEFFGQKDQDEFKRNAGRTQFGSGLRYQINASDDLTFATSLSYLVEKEKFIPYEELSETEDGQSTFYIDKDRETPRYGAMAYINYYFKDDAGISLSAETQPAVKEIDNYKALYEASLFFNYNENVSFSFSFQHSHNSLPPYGVEKIDTSMDNSLILNYHKGLGKRRQKQPAE